MLFGRYAGVDDVPEKKGREKRVCTFSKFSQHASKTTAWYVVFWLKLCVCSSDPTLHPTRVQRVHTVFAAPKNTDNWALAHGLNLGVIIVRNYPPTISGFLAKIHPFHNIHSW